MNEYIKKNINRIIGIFLILQPILDILTGICVNTLKIDITLGIIVRILFLMFIMFVVVFIFKKKKLIIPYLIIGLYFALYIAGMIYYKDSELLVEIKNLVRTFFFPILLISLYEIKDELKISKMTLFTVLFLYLIFLFVPTLFGLGYKSYQITKVGTLGFFNSANEISGIISILTPIMFIIFYKSKKIIPIIILSIMYLVVILMIGTKTPLLSLIITSAISMLCLFIRWIKERKLKKIFISLIIVLIGCASLSIIVPKTNFYKNIRTHLDYLELEHITDVFTDFRLVDHFIFSSRLEFLKNKAEIYNESSIYEKIFGIGYINNNKETKLIEMDYFDIYYSHGLIGFIIFFFITLLLFFKVFNNNILKGYENKMMITSLGLIVFLSFFTGHIITAPSVSIITIIIILSLAERKKKDLLFTDYNLGIGGIEKAQINLLKYIDYSKYKVTLILEEKKGELLEQVNENVNIREIKVSNNKDLIIRKTINLLRKLIFKIFEYDNYDFSCCYTTYSYSSAKLALIGSTNSALYVHSDYKKAYSTIEEFRKFFDTRSIDKFKHIIFVSKEAEESFKNEYKNLSEKCLVLNNYIDIDEIKYKSKEKIDIKKSKDKTLFVYVGRLDDSSKKLTRAINLIKEIKELELWIVGDGPDRKMYEDIVMDNKLSSRIKFIGAKINPYPYLNEADYSILTSDYEGFPVTYLEALVLNKKIITTIPTSDEQIDISKCAYIISKDENKMIKEVKSILKKKEKLEKIDLEKIQKDRMKRFEKIFND